MICMIDDYLYDLFFLFLGDCVLLLLPLGTADLSLTLTPPSSSSGCRLFFSFFLSTRQRPALFFFFSFLFLLAQQAVTCRVCDYLNIFFNLPHLCSQHRSPAEPIANFLREIFHSFTIQNHKPSVRRRAGSPAFWLPSPKKDK